MSDRIAVMNEGKVAQIGRPEDIYDRPNSRFVAGFIGQSNFLSAVVCAVENDIVVTNYKGVRLRAVTSLRPAVGAEVILTTRPERLRFADRVFDSRSADNRLAVTVTEAVFAGERCRYVVKADAGITMVLTEASSAVVRRRAVGEHAEIVWSVADTILV
ncbi:ABC-type Fe3+/spermidine/putrescine transport system ATPase subunit [Bradyrhizobium sp. i1.3.6]